MAGNEMVTSIPLPEFYLWNKLREQKAPLSFEIEITARCNNSCSHCCINLPANDRLAQEKELSFQEIKEIANQAVEMGSLWCLITGGEPLLREDFCDIYLYLRQKGLLVSVFTNATLISEKHISLFKKYPPRDIEVSVYGVTQETYERVTRSPGSFEKFFRGLSRLLENNIHVRLKAMALHSNFEEFPEIASFCRNITKDYFRFDPFLHLRFDGDRTRNDEIKTERLAPEDIIALERSDVDRFKALKAITPKLTTNGTFMTNRNRLFGCGAGKESFSVSCDGIFRLCSPLWHPDYIYDLRRGTLGEAWWDFVPWVRERKSQKRAFVEKCGSCPLINLCMWCPAHAHLESGELDSHIQYFCNIAKARAAALMNEQFYWEGTNEESMGKAQDGSSGKRQAGGGYCWSL